LGTLPEAIVFRRRLGLGIRPRFRRWICFDELPTERKQCGPVPRAENPEMADTHEASWQYMQQEAPEKLLDRQRHLALLVFMRRVTPSERHVVVSQGD
jgi:hypothetical protein